MKTLQSVPCPNAQEKSLPNSIADIARKHAEKSSLLEDNGKTFDSDPNTWQYLTDKLDEE